MVFGRRLASLIVFGALASGCTGIPVSESTRTSDNVEARAKSTRPAVPKAGTEGIMHVGTAGQYITVLFGESYMAASGRRCAYFFDRAGNKRAGNLPSGIACQGDNGDWIRIPPRIPVIPGP